MAPASAPPPIDPSLVPAASEWAYLDHAGVAPLPGPVIEAMSAWATGPGAAGSVRAEEQEQRFEEVRDLSARALGVPASQVAFVKNTTEGLGFVANGLTWHEGDRVVVPDGEFPSTIYPWLALSERGVVVDRVEPEGPAGALPVDRFAEAIASGRAPRLVVTSWVQFARGWRTDLAALATLAHDAGALLCVDVIQGLGVVPASLAAWGVDFAAADAHKWLLGPPGIGVLYVSGPCLELLTPLEPGWASVAHRQQWDNLELVLDEGARRLEGGSANACGLYGLGAALDLLLATGVEAIWRHVTSLCDYAVERLAAIGCEVRSDRSAAGRSGIVTFRPGASDPSRVVEALRAEHVACSPRGGGIRIAPHGYTTIEDVERLVDALERLLAGS